MANYKTEQELQQEYFASQNEQTPSQNEQPQSHTLSLPTANERASISRAFPARAPLPSNHPLLTETQPNYYRGKIRDKDVVEVFLTSGRVLQGIILQTDTETMLLQDADCRKTLIYKRNIETVGKVYDVLTQNEPQMDKR